MKGISYFDKSRGFAVNEGEFPNICVRWGPYEYFFYIAFSHRLKWHWYRAKP